MPTFAQSFFTRRNALRFIIGVALLVAFLVGLLLGLRACENWRGDRAWAAYRAAAEKRGARLQLADFIPPPVPDAENYAAIPVIQDLFAPRESGQITPDPLDWPKEIKSMPPKTTNPITGRRIDLTEWRDAFVTAHLLAKPSDNPARDVLDGLARYEPILAQLHTAAQRPRASFPAEWKGISSRTPHLAFLMGSVRFHALRMAAHLALGDSPAAYTDWRDGLAVYRALEHEPGFIAGANRTIILLFLENAIWDGLAGRQWADAELRSLAADLAAIDLFADLQYTIASERGNTNATIDWYATLPIHNLYASGEMAVSGRSLTAAAARFIDWVIPPGWARQSQVKINQLYDQRLARFEGEHGVLSAGPSGEQELMRLKRNGTAPGRWMFVSMMMLELDSSEARYLALHTNTQQARLACALELFRRAHHAFPDRLEELVPDFLDALPRDVMDGAPIRYRREGEKYKLWGVALNRQDDHGEIGSSTRPAEQLDWIWEN